MSDKTHAEILSAAGALPTVINEALGNAIGLIDSARPLFEEYPQLKKALILVTAATLVNDEIGTKLKALEHWNTGQPGTLPPVVTPGAPPPVVTPGTPPVIIGDVGGNDDTGPRQPWHVMSIGEMTNADWLYAANTSGVQGKIWGSQATKNDMINMYSRVGGWKYAQLFPDPDNQYDANTYAGVLK